MAAVGAALLGGGLLAAPSRAGDAPAAVMDEVVVTGERAGPGLWHVHRGSAQLWIMGTVTPLPKNMTWRSKQLEQVLDGTNQVLVRKPYEIGIARALWLLLTQRDLIMVGGGKRLKDVMPADLYARFAAQRAKLTGDADKWERYRPIIATLFLQEAALHQVGLSTRLELGKEVRDLAHKHHVRIDEIKVAAIRDFLDALKSMPAATENKCVAAGWSIGPPPGRRATWREFKAFRSPPKSVHAATRSAPMRVPATCLPSCAAPGLRIWRSICKAAE